MKTLITSLLLSALLPVCADTMTSVGGIDLPLAKEDLKLQGAGLLRKGYFFKIYVGALYVEAPVQAEPLPNDQSRRIDIHFFHHTPKKHMIRAADSTLRKNLSEELYLQLKPSIQKLHEAYINGRKGSYASIIYRPGEGLTYAYDDEAVITINCDDFARAYFKVWLGNQPSSRSVKEAMLGDWGERKG